MLPAPHQKPYTLLLSIDDLLVTSTWDVSSFVTTFILNPAPLLFALFSVSITLTTSYSVNMAGARPNVQVLTILSPISPNSTRLSFSQPNIIMYVALSCRKTFCSSKHVTDRTATYRKARSVQLLYHVQALPRVHQQLREWSSEGFIVP
jgi:hypothetical protein